MRTTSFLSSEADRTVNLQIYRTEEALFIYQPARMAAFFKKGFRIALYVSLGLLAMFAIACMSNEHPPEDFHIMIPMFCAMSFMYLGLFALLLGGTNYLLRIDSSHIVITSSWFGIRSTKKAERPEKLELYKDREPGCWRFKGLPSWASFPAEPHEIGWLRKVFDEFSARAVGRKPAGLNNVSSVPREEQKLRPLSLWERVRVACLFTNSPPSPCPCMIYLPKGERELQFARPLVRSILKTKEYHGEPLVRVPYPSDERMAKPSETVGLSVRCPYCDAELPKENVWFDETAGQCPDCRLVFQINDLKFRTPPKRCRSEFREDAAGLHLHQKPRHVNIYTLYLLGMFPLFLLVCGMILSLADWNTQVLFNKEVLRIASGSLLFLAAVVIVIIQVNHVHRFVDFGSEIIRFRTRFLFWEHRRSVSRREIGPCYRNGWCQFFNGVCIPYGNGRYFYICAPDTEQDYLASTINRWLWQNPPRLGSPVPEAFISGVGEDESEWRMFCPSCGRQFFGKEVDFQHRESAMCCPNCQHSFTLPQMHRFVLESVPGLAEESLYTLPEMPGLRSEQTDGKLTVEYAPLPTWKRILETFAGEIMMSVFFGTMLLFLMFAAINDAESRKGIGAGMMIVMLFMGLPVLPLAWYNLLASYDKYRGLYARWSIQIDRHRFVIHRHYAEYSESVDYDRREISKICRSESREQFASPLWGRFPSLLCNAGRGGIELTLRDGTVVYLPHLPLRDPQGRINEEGNCRLVNHLNRFMAAG